MEHAEDWSAIDKSVGSYACLGQPKWPSITWIACKLIQRSALSELHPLKSKELVCHYLHCLLSEANICLFVSEWSFVGSAKWSFVFGWLLLVYFRSSGSLIFGWSSHTLHVCFAWTELFLGPIVLGRWLRGIQECRIEILSTWDFWTLSKGFGLPLFGSPCQLLPISKMQPC
jgi:hypothetical protein